MTIESTGNRFTDLLNQAEGSAQGQGAATPAQEGKTFTQDEVNNILRERLQREKVKNEAVLIEREKALAGREILLTAREKITAKGLPAELLEALNVSSPEALEKSLEIIDGVIKNIKSRPPKGTSPGASRDAIPHFEDDVRGAFGLQ